MPNTILVPSKHPFLSLSLEFAELCRPLQCFHLSHITMQKHFKDGSRITLSNQPQWILDYYNLGLYQSSLFEESPVAYQAGFDVWIGEYDLDVYRHGREFYNSTYSISLTNPVIDGCEFYIFGASAQNLQSIHYLANQREILYHFILYLKDRGSKLLAQAERYRLILKKPISDPPLWIADTRTHQQMEQIKQQFFKNTPIHRYVLEQNNPNRKKLNSRELQCIKYLLQRKTAPEIALIMNISIRTVESYLNNIKLKLNCLNKIELLEKIKKERFLIAL